MYIHYMVGAIFTIFILCVHCDNAANDNEIKEILVPSAPRNLIAYNITSEEVNLAWIPPSTFTRNKLPIRDSKDVEETTKTEPQGDEPNDVIPTTDTLIPEKPKDLGFSYDLYKNEDIKQQYEYASSILLDTPRSRRDVWSHRHRKRRQDNGTNGGVHLEYYEQLEIFNESTFPIEVVKKWTAQTHKETTQMAYVLYYEQGVPRYDANVSGVQTPEDVLRKNIFPSNLGIRDNMKPTMNLTLWNKAGKVTKVVGFRLRNLKPFTPYKIWVRAFYYFPLDNVTSSDLLAHLGPESEPLYVLTDVRPPSAPIILNLTCDQPKRTLYLQWRQPLEYNNSIDQYVVTLRKIPELQPRTRLTLPTNKNDIETTISVEVELWNVTRYEVKIYAVTLSVTRDNVLINGSESPPEEVSSEWCAAHSEAMSPGDARHHVRALSTAALVALVPLVLLAALALALLYWRCRSRLSKCISAAYNYLEEGGERAARAPLNVYKKPVNCSPLRSCALGGAEAEGAAETGARPPRMAGHHHPAISATDFPRHVAALHADGDIGFSKEYEIVVARSNALAHTSHHSHRPENRLKNRYLNITAYDHSRVCVSAGGRCGAAGCVGAGRGGACDYVNANFIDGMLPALQPHHVARIRRRLERLERLERRAPPDRQPSVKASKPPPNLADGIESAFLNIEFSGIVESDEQNDDSDSDRSDDDSELDDVYVDLEGVRTRVKLEWLLWKRRYIATQGPTPATLDAFWRMIVQHRVHTIVMITNLVERGRRKCDMYWPAGGAGSCAEFGGVRVALVREDVRAAYTVRDMRVTDLTRDYPGGEGSARATRDVVQYHYTVWPDHGTPRHPLAVLPFVRAAAQHPATVLVHCSAGVGRTGTYIVLDAQLNQLKLTGTLSPLGYLCRARTQRNHLVQTEEQYVFVHDALLEHVRSGNTEVEYHKCREYLLKLLEDISEDDLAVLDLNPPKRKSIDDLTVTNGVDEASSVKSSQLCSEKEVVENGSQISIKTDDNSEQSKSAASEVPEEQKEVLVNGDDAEGVYDLAPRSTDTYTKKMAAYNNMSEVEKEELRRANRAENYALLERMRSFANRHNTYQGPPPVNLLEKQFLLITRSCVDASACARAPHNAEKNRPDGVLPSDTARVMLVPKPGVEGSEYVNASWVCGRRRLREFAVAQHPPPAPAAAAPPPAAGDLWRLLWDHTAQLVLALAPDDDPECEVFWPTEDEKELFVANFRASFVSKDTYVAYRKSDKSERRSPVTPVEPETNGYRRQESDCADDERLIPENSSPVSTTEPAYRFDRTELRLERLSAGNRDLSARKSIANGDLFASLSEKKNGPKSPRSPSKMSLKNFKLSSPTKFKFPDWGSRAAGSPPDTAPPPPPVAPALSVEEEAELRRPCYRFEKVDKVPENTPSDRVIEVINVSVHSLQDDYQLTVKFIKCSGWLDGDTTEYTLGKPEENQFIKAVRQAAGDAERNAAIDRLIQPYADSFALVEYVAGCQMEYKNGPVVVVDKFGGWKAMTFCALSAAGGGAGLGAAAGAAAGAAPTWSEGAGADVYCWAALGAAARCPSPRAPHAAHAPHALLAAYCALAAYGPRVHAHRHRLSNTSNEESR